MRLRSSVFVIVPLVFAGFPAQAGLWDDVKGVVGDAREVVSDVKDTRDEAKGTAREAKDIVDETSDDVEAVVPERKAAPAPAPAPPSAKRPPPPSARVWQLDEGGGQTRELSQAELVQKIRAGQVGPDDFVYGGALADWTAAGEVPVLQRYFGN